jgi:Cu+-exporting ATPase
MHGDIVQDRPGPCPKCGMALEPSVVQPADVESPELIDMRHRFWVSASAWRR